MANRTSIIDIDPEDPTQSLDDAGQFSVVDLETDAQPHSEAEAELDAAVATTADDLTDITDNPETRDSGDLYGVHLPRAADREDESGKGEPYEDDDEALGENVFESLGKRMAEGGAAAEREIDPTDDSDRHSGHHKSDRRDRPVADKGSGGPSGL